MTTAQESLELTRVGPGTTMGDFMRQYWIPAAMSSELQSGQPPVRLMLLGEKLIGFRDKAGKVGIMDQRCPHRCASLFFGRTEDDGIRCVYHGWKFGADGQCLEQPNLTAEQNFADKVRAKAYPVQERNGVVWVYMGAAEQPPALPSFEANLMPEGETVVRMVQRECNWLQALEGDIDTSHFGFLHVGSVKPDNVPEGHPIHGTVSDRAPQYLVREREYGTQYAAYRPHEDGRRTYWRFNNFMFPFWTQTPQAKFETYIVARGWVPMDDTHTMFISIQWMGKDVAKNRTNVVPLKDGGTIPGSSPDKLLPNTAGWYGRWRMEANADNDYLIDRDAQMRDEIFTGIDGIHLQDQAITESMGGVVDHTFERLAPSDQMITRSRRAILRAARAFRDTGAPPPGVENPDIFRTARAGFFVEEPDVDWEEAYEKQVESAVRAADYAKQAAE